MSASKKYVLVVNVLFWIVAALLHPLASLAPTESGETPKVFSLLIPIFFLLLAFGSTAMIHAPQRTAGIRSEAGRHGSRSQQPRLKPGPDGVSLLKQAAG